MSFLYNGLLVLLLLTCVGDIELDPALLLPQPANKRFFYSRSLCHRNLSSIATYPILYPMTLLQAYNMKHNFDIIYLSDKYQNFSIQHDDERHLNGSIYMDTN